MTRLTRTFLTKLSLGALIIAATMIVVPDAFARGGAANLLNSPGYQRALEESRKRLPPANAQPVQHHKTQHHRHSH